MPKYRQYTRAHNFVDFACIPAYTVLMKTSEIAKKHSVTRFFVRMVERGDRKTTDISLAIAIAEKNGSKPIDYVSLRIRPLAIEAHPFLNKKLKKVA